ncbi:hypothetical protein KFL_007860020 [Klebsormidium nitens]|uniref:TraB family protein n=1 Tax=Klebsormidium nitens TaxID=105231 RepID=A0A1Y1IQB9_KLENI|nr:hypothetical protein KFL_007860020 [Klebsormidium nitens]|eukprot:GAQ91441.1 hypothetical protein KFL_007860020 [Klebsormidium nitens]
MRTGEAIQVFRTKPEARALFESPELLRNLSLPDETKAFVRVLKNPETECVIYLIGTVHVSPDSRDDVRMLIQEVQPEKVAVEGHVGHPCKIDAELTFVERHFGSFLYVMSSAYENRSWILHFLAEAYLSNRGNPDFVALDSEKKDDDDDIVASKAFGRLFRAFRQGAYVDLPLLKKNCALSAQNHQVVRCFHTIPRGRPPSMADQATYRSYQNKELAKLRADDDLGNSDVLLASNPKALHALLGERDLYMAGELAQCSFMSKTIVAVVGAAHVPGIQKHFPEETLFNHISNEGSVLWERRREAELEESNQKSANLKAKMEASAERAGTEARLRGAATCTAMTLARVGAFALHKRHPRAAINAAKLGGAAALLTGAARVGLAYATAQWTQFGAYLRNAEPAENA